MAELVDKYEAFRKSVNFIKRYRDAQNAASGSEVDANSNVSSKNIATMAPEIHKKDNIYTNRLWMYDTLTEMYGKEIADKYLDQLEKHEIYRHDEAGMPVGTPYCASITLYPFLFDGMTKVGGTTTAPKHLKAFVGGFINLVFAISAQLCGAVAVPELIAYLDYYIRKEYGDDYRLHVDDVATVGLYPETIGQVIDSYFNQIVYSLNQPAAARGSQSVFLNFAYFDSPYFHQLFEGFVFPDGSDLVSHWDSVNWLQRRFMKWFNKERTKNLLTFPVESFSLLNDGKTFVDKDSADFVAEMYAEGHSFFTYTSDSVDSLASCCYSGDTKVLIKDAKGAYLVPISEVKHMKFDQNGFRIFNNGKWSKGSYVELPGRPLYEVTLTNGAVMKVTDNHRNNCFGGMKLTKDLTTSDYIMMNSTPVDTYPEADEHLTYEQGFAIGAFLGDGSMGSEYTDSNGTTCIYEVNYSLSESKRWIIPLLEKANKQFGGTSDVREGKMYNNVLPVRVSSKQLAAAIMRWTNWQRGIRSETKALNVDCVLQSIEFRKGIVDGWMATDGNMNSAGKSNSVRGYSTSVDLIDTMQAICTSLGYITTVSVDNRTEGPVFRGVQYNKNYPVYGLLKYANHKHTRIQKDTCIFRDNSYWFRVKSIKPLDRPETVYCFEMDDVTDDKFTLPNGIHNYNCRLRNGIQDNQFSYTLGAGGVSTGSKCVMTININRLVQNTHRAWEAEGSHGDFLTRLSSAVADQTELIHKYLLAINKIICDMRDHHMISIYDAGFIAPEKQYLTCGINGLVEGAEYLGIEPTDNDQYAAYVNAIMSPIYEINKRDKTRTVMFNTEMVPAENLGVKFAKWDKKDGYFVPRDCYNSYFYRVEDPTLNFIDKLRLHGSKYTGRLDGGSAAHLNSEEHLTKDQYWRLLHTAIRTGCNYFTFNIPNSICNKCGHIEKHRFDKCPVCGSEDVDYASRIIGYLQVVSKWSLDRQKEAARRYYDTKGI